MNDLEKLQRAQQAANLLEDPVLTAALEAIEEKFIGIWRRSQYGDQKKRESAYHMQAAVVELRAQLTKYVTDGKVIDHHMRAEKARADREAEERGEEGHKGNGSAG
jgi:hypothetical protein